MIFVVKAVCRKLVYAALTP
nr:hypothetical protein [Vibrio sp. S9_S30]